jgi:putative ABC transport system substrate-binding protein
VKAQINRRRFIALLCGAAAGSMLSPIIARAQQAMPVIGFLSGQSPDTYAPFPAAFRQGPAEAGFVDGHNVKIEYRWARSHFEALPALAADLVRLKVDVISATGGVLAVRAVKALTQSIPAVFNSGEDPVQAGIVTSLNRPGGNITGISWFNVDSVAKRLSLLHQIAPAAAAIAFLANPKDPELEPQLAVAKNAAQALGLRLLVFNAATPADIDTAYAALAQQGAGARSASTSRRLCSRSPTR